MPKQLAHIPILTIRYPDTGKTILHQQRQEKLGILTVCLLLPNSFGSDPRGIPNPQLESKFCE